MKKNPSYNITSLLYGPELRGPINQVLFAQNFAQSNHFTVNILASVRFDRTALQASLITIPLNEEFLLIGQREVSEMELHLVYRSQAKSCIHVATGYLSDRDIEIHEEFREASMEQKLNDELIQSIFNRVWDNPDLVKSHLFPFPED